jgi:maleate isomerase
MPSHSGYGRLGTLGIATPQANPTAEPEFRALLPSGVSCATVRMHSDIDAPDQRLMAYFEELGSTLSRFDALPLAAIGIACTGSSYLLGCDKTSQLIHSLSKEISSPIVTAAAAIEEALITLGAKRIALVSPYPDWLGEAARGYWSGRDFELVDCFSLAQTQGDTRAIYALDGTAAAKSISDHWEGIEADAYLITGTGLPTLPFIADLTRTTGKPVLTSNLCLAWCCLKAANIEFGEHHPNEDMPLLAGWESAVARL